MHDSEQEHSSITGCRVTYESMSVPMRKKKSLCSSTINLSLRTFLR